MLVTHWNETHLLAQFGQIYHEVSIVNVKLDVSGRSNFKFDQIYITVEMW